jgi:hypothetical protein
MARNALPQEVEVLRFFEIGPIEKVEAVFNIVCEKMRERQGRDGTDSANGAPAGSRRRRKKYDQAPGGAPSPDSAA